MESYSVFRVAYKVKKINFIPRACNEYALHRIAVLSAIPTVSRTVLRAGGRAGKVLIRRSVPATQIFFFHLSSETTSHYFSINIRDQHYTGWDYGSDVEIDFKTPDTLPFSLLKNPFANAWRRIPYSDYSIGWTIRHWNPGRGRRFFSFPIKVQTTCGVHLVSYSMGTMDFCRG